jgi:hypothetical protein
MLTTSSIVNFYKQIKSTMSAWHDQRDDKNKQNKIKMKGNG